ncbi:MAG TPA: exonuclease SbcCD subunit D [Chloroflexota bacterium]|jgi:exonuclease SbcD|nr:exonuclease SbcCD subunit D [Chloroflexota bacterium]
MIRLLHLADVHLGVETFGRIDPATGLNSRLLDFTARLDEAIDHAIQTRVDLVLFAGDAYRSRDPSPTQQREFAKRIRRLSEAGIPTFLLVGNHDLPAASGRANSLDIYETLGVPNVTIGRSTAIYRIETKAGPVQILALPWLRRSALLARPEFRSLSAQDARRAIEGHAAEFITTAAEQLEPDVPAILAAHVSVEGATYGSERSVLVGEDIVLPRSTVANPAFSYVALGHIHKHQVLYDQPLVLYPGSLERVDFGEERDPKGFVTVEIDGKEARYQFHPVGARRFATIRARPTGEEPTAAILRDLERAEPAGAVVRLIVEAEPEVDARIDYALVRRALREAYAVAGIRREVTRPERRQTAVAGVESLSALDALDLYLKSKQVPDERRALLLQYAQRFGIG